MNLIPYAAAPRAHRDSSPRDAHVLNGDMVTSGSYTNNQVGFENECRASNECPTTNVLS